MRSQGDDNKTIAHISLYILRDHGIHFHHAKWWMTDDIAPVFFSSACIGPYLNDNIKKKKLKLDEKHKAKIP